MTSPLPATAPAVTPETEEFWAATAEGHLLLRRCDDCGIVIWYPRAHCPSCASLNTSWTQAEGFGSVYTFTVVHRSMVEGFRDAVPYVIAYVELDEGPRVLTNIVDCDPESVEIGQRVSAVFHDTGNGSALFRFRPG